MRHETELPRHASAPGLARACLADWCANALDPHELYQAKLLVSELVTNAVVHGEGSIHLYAELDDDRVLVEVLDQGTGFEHQLRQAPFDQMHGRGLAIVDAASSRWGIHEGTTHVWFEIERSGPRLGASMKPAGEDPG